MKMYLLLVCTLCLTSPACTNEPHSSSPTDQPAPAYQPDTSATQREPDTPSPNDTIDPASAQPKPDTRRTTSTQAAASKTGLSSAEKPAHTQSKAQPQPAPSTPQASAPKTNPAQSQAPADKPEPATQPAPAPSTEAAPPAAPAPPSHAIWDELLRKFVDAKGWVNYRGLKKEQSRLEQYLQLLSSNPPQPSWSRAETMAFWINAYNAFTVKLILDHYPVSSITKIHNGQPWKVSWIRIGDKSYSLDEIENGILRPRYKEPRIHFAVNCAARSCPPLLNQAWTAQNLEANFEKQAKAFINNPTYNKITPNSAQLSKIFEWYAEDFGDLIGFLNRYASVKIKPDARISYLEYDWSLNGQ